MSYREPKITAEAIEAARNVRSGKAKRVRDFISAADMENALRAALPFLIQAYEEVRGR